MRSSALVGYIFLLLVLVIYSYSQIDLNLTLSSWFPYQVVQQHLITFGYFNRALATNVYILLISGLFLFWLYFLRQAYCGKIPVGAAIKLVGGVSLILVLAYPAFSHDLFNYLFDARIMTLYGQNPYTHRPLDFPDDLWLRFMHWTHRYTPYGPVWLGISTVPSFLGMGKFVATLFGFKALAASAHVVSAMLIARILARSVPKYAAAGVILFGLHPLGLIESLVSAHNDVVMMVFALASVWMLQLKRYVLATFLFLLSFGIKYVTAVLAPIGFASVTKRLSYQVAVLLSIGALLVTVGLVVAQVFNKGATGAEFHPWFLLWPLAFAALVPRLRVLHALLAGFALGLLARYIPYLLVGDYPQAVQQAKSILTLVGTLGGILVALSVWRKHGIAQH